MTTYSNLRQRLGLTERSEVKEQVLTDPKQANRKILTALPHSKDAADCIKAILKDAGISSRQVFAGHNVVDVTVSRKDWHAADRLIYGSLYHRECCSV